MCTQNANVYTKNSVYTKLIKTPKMCTQNDKIAKCVHKNNRNESKFNKNWVKTMKKRLFYGQIFSTLNITILISIGVNST